jgi:integral membrane protein (TIGR01906 family)
MKNKLFTVLFGVAVFFFIIAFSIGLPIYCRFFYYVQINALNLPEFTGFDYATIKQAYDSVLDYLVFPWAEFSTGALKYNQSGMEHFVDCKVLFDINAIALILSTAVIVTTLILQKKKVITLCRPFKMSVAFISAVSIFVVIIVVGGLASIDFNSAFTIFHHIFFPGKDNWLFNPRDMEIILILPQEFFLNCALLIGASIVIISLTIIIYQLIKRKSFAKKTTD